MGMNLFGLRDGTWWFESKQDSRWNVSGSARVGMFMNYEQCADAKRKYDELKELYGEPSDLKFGYMKD